MKLGDRRVVRPGEQPDAHRIAAVEFEMQHGPVDDVVEIGRHFRTGYGRELLIPGERGVLVVQVDDQHRLIAVQAEAGTDAVGQVAAVVRVRQAVQEQVAGQFVRTFVAVGIVVRDVVIGEQLNPFGNRFGIRDAAADPIAFRVVQNQLVQLRSRVRIQVARQRILGVVPVVFRGSPVDRNRQHPAVPAAEFVHEIQVARNVVSRRIGRAVAFEKVQQRIARVAVGGGGRRRVGAVRVVGLETERRTEHQLVVVVDFVFDQSVDPVVEVAGVVPAGLVV